MLDHLSGGRLMLGVGRGGALIEHQRMGVEPKDAQALYHEAFAVLMHAFENDVVNFDGKFFRYRDYLVQQRPVQRPHPRSGTGRQTRTRSLGPRHAVSTLY